jgi:hypothetical protein
MAKLILLSIIFASIALPARAARQANPKKGLRKVIIYVLVFNALYLFALRFVWMRFL